MSRQTTRSLSVQAESQLLQGQRRTSRWRRLWRFVWRSALGVVILLALFVVLFIANPFERGVGRNLEDLIPPGAPAYLHVRDLRTSFHALTQTPEWHEKIEEGGWRDAVEVVGPVLGASPQEMEDVRRVLGHLESNPAQAQALIGLGLDLVGQDVAFALLPAPGEGGQEDLRLVLYTKVGYTTKFLLGAVELFGGRMGLVGGGLLERPASRHLVVHPDPDSRLVIHVFRHRDVLMVSTYDQAKEELLQRLEQRDAPSLPGQTRYIAVMRQLPSEDAALSGFVDFALLERMGVNLEQKISQTLSPDLRACLLESLDFAAWRAAGMAWQPSPLGTPARFEFAVDLSSTAGSRAAVLADLYRQKPHDFASLDVVPDDVAFVKTTNLSFKDFWDLTYPHLSRDARDVVEGYVLNDLQYHAAEIKPVYADLIGFLGEKLGDEFSVYVVRGAPADREGLLFVLPHIACVFPTKDPAAISTLIADMVKVLPKINASLFTEEDLLPERRNGVSIYRIQQRGAPLDKLLRITPVFLVTDRFVVLLSSEELLDASLDALESGTGGGKVRAALQEVGGADHSFFYLDGAGVHDILADHWLNVRELPEYDHAGKEAAARVVERQRIMNELLQAWFPDRNRDQGPLIPSKEDQDRLREEVEERLFEPEAQARIASRVEEQIGAARERYMRLISFPQHIDHVVLSAHYAPSLLRATLVVVPRREP